MTKVTVPALLGLARSLLMYYAIPGRARAWRAFYRQFIRTDEVCFDIGAHAGNRSAAMLAIGGRVLAAEPQPLFANLLRRLYGRDANFTLVTAALGAESGKTQMLVSSQTPTVSTVSTDWAAEVQRDRSFSSVDWDEHIEVDVITLDSLIAEYGLPVFVKLDIEGYEEQALQGLSRPVAALSYEFVPAALERAWACLERLQALGYRRFNFIKGEYPRFALPTWLSAAALRAAVAALPNDGRAGEIYATLGG